MVAKSRETMKARVDRAKTISSHYDDKKLRELVIHVAQRSAGDPNFGPIKLNKILFHADFIAYGLFGHPITGAEYVKLEYGPGPKGFPQTRDEMVEARDIALEKLPSGVRGPQYRIVALRDPDLAAFTATEIALVDQWIDALRNVDPFVISEVTHGYRGWRVAPALGDTIPYGAVFLSDSPPTEYEIERAAELIQQHGWNV
jgi:antitoxin SocA-like protein